MQELLASIGLSSPEIKAYECLLKTGVSSVGRIIKETNIPSSHIYDVLEKLISKGLASHYSARNVKYFEATDPSNLKKIYEEQKQELLDKEKQLKDKISMLQALVLNRNETEETNIRTYDGIAGIKSAIEKVLKVLKKDETYFVLGAPFVGNKKLNAFYREFHEQRVKKNIRFKIIYNKAAEEFARERKSSSLSEIRISYEDTPTELCIYSDYVQIIIFSQKPILLEVKNKEISQSFKEHFQKIWDVSQKI
jgi:sugar-specific transcriptional regulator TrmB